MLRPGDVVRLYGGDVWSEPSSVLATVRCVVSSTAAVIIALTDLASGPWAMLLLVGGGVGWVRNTSLFIDARDQAGSAV